jgi:hypothetical protein
MIYGAVFITLVYGVSFSVCFANFYQKLSLVVRTPGGCRGHEAVMTTWDVPVWRRSFHVDFSEDFFINCMVAFVKFRR